MNAILAAVVAAVVLHASASRASETLGVLAVADPPGPGAELAELTAQFRAALAERAPGFLEPSQLRERMTGQAPNASLPELDRAYAGALATYQAGDFEGSVRTLRAVISDLERVPDSAEAFEQWSRAHLRLARAEQTLGHRAEAQTALERLVRANPQVKVDPNQYPPSFVKQVEDVRTQLRSLKSHKLTVNAQKGVRVFVDRREVGAAPLTVELTAGMHRVSGAYQGLPVPGVIADLTIEDQTVTLDVALAEALRPSSGPGLAVPAADRVRRIVTASAWLGLDRVVVASFTQESDVTFLVGSVYDVRRGATQRQGYLRLSGKTPPPGGLGALATFLMTGQRSPPVTDSPAGTLPADALKPVEPKPADLSSIARSRVDVRPSPVLGWTAVGTGVATLVLGGVSIYGVVSSGKSYDDARAMLAPDGSLRPPFTVSQYNRKVSDGDGAKRLAVGTGVGAGAALIATGVLGYLSYKQTGEVGPFRF